MLHHSPLAEYFEAAERLLEEGKLFEATKLYQILIANEPDSADAWYALAEIATLNKDTQSAQEYEKRVFAICAEGKIAPQEVCMRLYNACKKKSLRELRKGIFMALATRAHSAQEYIDMATLVRDTHFLPGAITLYQKALALDPQCPLAHTKLAEVYQQMGMHKEALTEYQTAVRQDPKDIVAVWGDALFLPTIYESEEARVQWRKRWQIGIKRLLSSLPISSPEEVEGAFVAALFHTDFLLAYQGESVFEDQKLYGELISKIARAKYPAYRERKLGRRGKSKRKDSRKQDSKQKIRVGFVSKHFHWHSIYKTHGAYLTKLDPDRFEVYTFYLGIIRDEATKDIEEHSKSFFYGLHDVTKLIEQIAASDLDVLIYPDIGMYALSNVLAALRLAPVQCNALGHPVTSGMKTVDYMLSSALMEPEDAKKEYLEQLVLLDNLSACYPEPDVRKAVLPNGLSKKEPHKTVYVNVQNLLKLLPRHDDIYPRIAQLVPDAEFHFIGTLQVGAFTTFFNRLEKAFASFGLDVKKYCVFHPSMPQGQFFGLLQHADVVLDSLDWSGFNSTMEALAFDKPVVTLPGASCRSRHSYAILTLLECPELIADTKEAYIELAAKLCDPNMRKHIAAKIAKNKIKIYNDMAPIKALERFLTEAVRDKSAF